MTTLQRVSFEFFPPRDAAGLERLAAVRTRLDAAAPEFYSVTYGAGGSTRDRTRDLVLDIHAEGRTVAPHLSIGSDAPEAVQTLLDAYRQAGIRHLVALRGDIPSGLGSRAEVHYAEELVTLVRAHSGDHFRIFVAAYPEVHPDSRSPESDLAHFADKVAAGADEAITQYFYNADAYFDFVGRCQHAGVKVPIVPGIMPITNYANLLRFSEGCGAEIPRWIRKRLEHLQDDTSSLQAFGLDVVTDLCERLLAGGIPGLHIYSMNQSKIPLALLDRLGHPLAGRA
ncbi:MAG: methylenetetrahydrofolate reductase [NAD(P)H] [Gammaproteobacteria bacterium]|nr:methylenetetrahydrofolate reductase [NAD(P)H] [Gammaproteobacteria bacterium]